MRNWESTAESLSLSLCAEAPLSIVSHRDQIQVTITTIWAVISSLSSFIVADLYIWALIWVWRIPEKIKPLFSIGPLSLYIKHWIISLLHASKQWEFRMLCARICEESHTHCRLLVYDRQWTRCVHLRKCYWPTMLFFFFLLFCIYIFM